MRHRFEMVLMMSLLLMACNRKPATTVLSCCAKDHAVAAAVPYDPLSAGRSIYQSPEKWTDAHNRPVKLSDLKGKVQVVAMIFTHCGYACPRLVQDIKAIADSLPAAAQREVGFVLVSLDPERDDPAQLERFMLQEGLDDRWELLHGSPDQVRELSMLLNVKYQKLPDGNFAHSNAIFILDKAGDVVQSMDGLEPQTDVAIGMINHLIGDETALQQ